MRFTSINRKKTHVFPLLLDNRVTTGHSESLGQLIRFPSAPGVRLRRQSPSSAC